jgi:hypothetical protein
MCHHAIPIFIPARDTGGGHRPGKRRTKLNSESRARKQLVNHPHFATIKEEVTMRSPLADRWRTSQNHKWEASLIRWLPDKSTSSIARNLAGSKQNHLLWYGMIHKSMMSAQHAGSPHQDGKNVWCRLIQTPLEMRRRDSWHINAELPGP